MPPYDRRARQKGFNTRIPINTLSGGVGRQAPSKRLISESQVVENALPTLEKSIEKRPGSKQLVTGVSGGQNQEYGSLDLPNNFGALASLKLNTPTIQVGSTNFTFKNDIVADSHINLISTDSTSITYLANNNRNSGYKTEAITTLQFKSTPLKGGEITLISGDSTSVTYTALNSITGTIVGGKTVFNPGQFISQTASALQEAIYSSNGHNATARWDVEFSGAMGLDETITLISTDGTTRTYICKFSGSNGAQDGTNIVFLQGANARASALNLEAAVASANGHGAARLVATNIGGGNLNIIQQVDGVGSTSRVEVSDGWLNSCVSVPKPRFGKIHCVVNTDGTVYFEQCTAGSAGNTSVATTAKLNNALEVVPANFARAYNGVYFRSEATKEATADSLKAAIDSLNGHTSSKLTVVSSSGAVTITQVTAGTQGNTVVDTNTSFNNSVVKPVRPFTGGTDINNEFDGETVTLEDPINGVTRSFGFNSNLLPTNNQASVVGTKGLTTSALIAQQLAKVIRLNQIEIAATYDVTDDLIRLQMEQSGGNGNYISTSDETLFSPSEFRSGVAGERKFFYYWFSISEILRYLVVIDYSARGPADNLFYIYLIDTVNEIVTNQTPEINETVQDIYDYITYGNDVYEADEALDAVTIGTNIFFVNKFVKAGFSSNKDGYKFDLSGNVTEEIDYEGQEITYYTSSVVDPDGTALLYVPNKAYVGGTEVYNQYGVWKALADIRSESTAQFATDDTEETVIAADPGPPEYYTSKVDADLDANIWYPWEVNQALVDLEGNRRTNVGPLPKASVWAAGMTPSVQIGATVERKWKASVEDSSGIVTEQGDIVYDIAHSRLTCDSTISTADCHSSGHSRYIALWQYVRAVEQIPVEDNRYVDRTKQYLGQAYSDLSNVKLPPHPTDPNDIIDLAVLGSIPGGIPNYSTNLVGEAAISMGLLYEGKELTDYTDIINNTGSPALTTHEYGLGKILYVENAYADALPGYYRVQSATEKPFLNKVRTPHPFSMFDKARMPHQLSFNAPDDNNPTGQWAFSTINWNLRTTGTDTSNPGPKLFEDGKQSEIKALGYFRNRLWMAGEDKVFSSKLNDITNFFLDDATSITDEDPIDVTCSYNKYTEVINLTPFENNLFVNTGSDVQFTISGSDNLISPFTAEVSPSSFYSTAPLIKPILLGSQIYFFDSKRLYVYFNDKTVSMNNAVEVSYHCPDFLPEKYSTSTVVPSFDTILFNNRQNKKEVFCYTNRYSGEQVIQNAFFKYVYDRDVVAMNSYDSNIYFVTVTSDESRTIHHIQKQLFQEKDFSVPLLDNSFTKFSSAVYSPADDSTQFTFDGYYNPTIDTIVVDGESLAIQSFGTGVTASTVTVQGKYDTANSVYVGTKYTTRIQLSPIFYRDQGGNVIDGILSLRTMHLRHHNTGNYRIEVDNRNRVTTPIEFSSKEISTRSDLMPLDNFVVDGETVSKIFGYGDEVSISILSDYISPMNITNIEIKGRFNTTYSSWVR